MRWSWSGPDHVGAIAADVRHRADPACRREGLDRVSDRDRVIERVERAVLVETDLRAFDPGDSEGVFGVVFGGVEGMHRAAGLVQVGARRLRLVGVLAILPAALDRPHLRCTSVVVNPLSSTSMVASVRCRSGLCGTSKGESDSPATPGVANQIDSQDQRAPYCSLGSGEQP